MIGKNQKETIEQKAQLVIKTLQLVDNYLAGSVMTDKEEILEISAIVKKVYEIAPVDVMRHLDHFVSGVVVPCVVSSDDSFMEGVGNVNRFQHFKGVGFYWNDVGTHVQREYRKRRRALYKLFHDICFEEELRGISM